jgi:hypothetical protein
MSLQKTTYVRRAERISAIAFSASAGLSSGVTRQGGK